jgi:integrase/recombinase XerD
VADRPGITRDVNPHVLRHTFATAALRRVSLPTVQKILGHDRLATTAIFLDFTDVHIQDGFERKWPEPARRLSGKPGGLWLCPCSGAS